MTIETAVVKLEIKDQELINVFIRVFKQVNGFKIREKASGHTPDLIIFELGKNYDKDLNYIQSFLDQKETTEFFLLSKNSDQDILIKALRTGAKEFLPIPLKAEVINEALIRFQERRKKKQNNTVRSGRIFSVTGCKGGVGTTTVATNLAVSLALKQKVPSVALLDMNDVFGEISMFLDLTPKHHWANITDNIDRLDDFFLSNILSPHDTGIHILPSPRVLNEQPPTPAIMEILLTTMKKNFDYVVIDMGQSINDTAYKIFQLSDFLLLVTIQSLPCLSNTNMLIKSFVDYGFVVKENIQVVLNRYIKKGTVSRDDAQEGIGKKISWVIPNDYSATISAINSGKPLCRVSPNSKIVKSFNEYAEQFLPNETKKGKKRTWFSYGRSKDNHQ